MSKKWQNNLIVFFAIFAALLFLPGAVFAATTTDTLLHEYLLPIHSFSDLGVVDSKKGAECESQKQYSANDFISCQEISGTDVQKTQDGYLEMTKPAMVKYHFTVTTASEYSFNIQVSNLADNFANLTNEQIDYAQDGASLKQLINESDILSSDLTEYDLARNLFFSVYVNGKYVGYIQMKDTDPSEIQTGKIDIGALQPGTAEVELHFLNDYYYDFSQKTVPSYFNNFETVDLDADKILDTNPVIFTAALDKIQPTDDVIGIRVYQNQQNKYPAAWYADNVVNPVDNPQTITVDGYQGVKDGRTVYISAANLPEICSGGSNAGKDCRSDSDCPAGTCIFKGNVFSNIYVIAYNESATEQTINIYNQILDNFNFNTNLQKFYPSDYALKKGQLQRDTVRRADVNYLNQLLSAYHSVKGSFPALVTGTYVNGHSISTWPSWQSALANALGAGLPADPLNYLATSNSGQIDCKVNEAACAVVCSRDSAGNPATGCASGEQCVGAQYCSICPAGYDAQTCWDQAKLKFAFNPYTSSNCSNTSLIGALNLGGNTASCAYDGAYVYQYTSLDNGKKYLLNYRLEFQSAETCQPGQCIDADGKCVNPGDCLDTTSQKVCLAGSWVATCGDGFLEGSCGEDCDGKLGIGNLCSEISNHNWYTPVSGTCSSDCKLQTKTDLTQADCGGYCGDGTVQKDQGETCDNTSAYCVNCKCVPNCKNICGGADDGCGGKCNASCQDGYSCLDNKCQTKTCAQKYDSAGWECGAISGCDELPCTGSQICQNHKCVNPSVTACQPSCGDNQCGADSCGNENGCGICGIGKKCEAGKCVSDCKSTCLTLDNSNTTLLSKNIYPCGYDGCQEASGCYANSTKTCQGYKKYKDSDETLSDAWTCNPILGRCTCKLAAGATGACKTNQCSGYDACGNSCNKTCTAGPCNVSGGYCGKDKLSCSTDADECITCDDLSLLWAGDGASSYCYKYRTVDLTNIKAVLDEDKYSDITEYSATIYVASSFVSKLGSSSSSTNSGKGISVIKNSTDSGDGIRFVSSTNRALFYDYYIDYENIDVVPYNGSDYKKVLVKIKKNADGTWPSQINMLWGVDEAPVDVIKGLNDLAPKEGVGFNKAASVFDLVFGSKGGVKWDSSKWQKPIDTATVTVPEAGNNYTLTVSGEANQYEMYGIISKEAYENEIVRVDFKYSDLSSTVPEQWKAWYGFTWLYSNAEPDNYCGYRGADYFGEYGVKCELKQRYVSTWEDFDCPDTGGGYWWGCRGNTNLNASSTYGEERIFQWINENGKLKYWENAYPAKNRQNVTTISNFGKHKIGLEFGPDVAGGSFSATYDNLVARKYIVDDNGNEPIAEVKSSSLLQ